MHNEVSCRPIDEKCHFFPNILFNKFDILIMKIMLNCNEWPLKLCMRKFTLCSFLMNKLHEILLEYISKSVRRELLFWLSVYIPVGLCPDVGLWNLLVWMVQICTSSSVMKYWPFNHLTLLKITYPTAATILHYWDQSYTYFFLEDNLKF